MNFGLSNLKRAQTTSMLSKSSLKKLNKVFDIGKDGVSSLTSAEMQTIGKAAGLQNPLINEFLAKAKDADFYSKASAKQLKWSDAIKDSKNTDAIKQLLLKRSDILSKDTLKQIKTANADELQSVLKDTIDQTAELKDSLINVGNAGKSGFTILGNTVKGFLVTLKAIAPALIAITVAYAAFKYFDNQQHQYTNAVNKAKESITEYQQTKNEVESLNKQLEQTQERIEEINSQDTLTITDKAELETLKKQNDELERQLAIKQSLEGIQQDNAERDIKAAANTKKSYTELQEDKYGSVVGKLKSFADHISSSYNLIDYITDKNIREDASKSWKDSWFGLKDLTPEKLRETLKKVFTGEQLEPSLASKEMKGKDTTAVGLLKSNAADLEKYQKQYIKNQLKLKDDPTNQKLLDEQDRLNESIAQTSETLSTQSDLIQSWIEACADSTDTETKAMVDQWQKALGQVQNIGKSKLQKDVNNLNTYFSTNSGSIMKKYLEDIVTKSGNASDALTEFERVGMSLDDIGVSSDAFTDYFQDIIDGSSSASEAIEDMSDTLVGTYDNLAAAIESANASEKFDNLKTWYESVKEMYEKGDVGTDDFQTMAQFGVGYNIKKRLAGGGYEYRADAYVEAYQQAEQMLERWYGGDDEAQNTQNIIDDFVSAGLMKYNEATNDYDVIKENFQNTAKAAQALGTSIDNVEVAMGKLDAKGFEFDNIDKSGEMFKDYQDYLEKIRTIRDSLNNGTLKDSLSDKISGWDTELDQFDNDLTTLTEPKVIEIKFEYDLAALQQKTQEAAELARSSGENSDWAAAIVSQKSERSLLDDKTGYTTSGNDAAFNNTDAYIDKIYDNMAGKTAEERLQLNQAAYALQEFQNQFLQLRAEGSTMDWNQFIGSDQAAQTMSDVKKMTGFTLGEIKGILSSGNLDFIIGANTDQADEKVEEEKDKVDKTTASMDLDVDTRTLDQKLSDAEENLRKNFTSYDGEINFNIPGAQDALDLLKELEVEKQEVASPIVMNLDPSNYSGEMGDAIRQLQEFQDAVNNLKALQDIKDLGFNIDTSDAEQKVNDLYNKLKDNSLMPQLGIDTSSVDNFENSLMTLSDKDFTIGVDTSGEEKLEGLKTAIGEVADKNVKVAAEVLGSDFVQNLNNKIGAVADKNVTVGATVFGTGAVSALASAIGGVVGKVVSVGVNLLGKIFANGTAHSLGTAYASGNWGAKESGTSLVGELGTEIVVDPTTSTWRTVGDNGAEFVNIKRGQIVFNHRQSEELLKNGYVTSSGGRGKVQGGSFALGTAYESGSGGRYQKYTPLVPTKKDDDKKNTSSKSSSGTSSGGSGSRNSGSSSGGSTRSSSGGSSGGSSSSSDAKSTTEEIVDFIKIMLSRLSRMTELATDAIERAVGLANKQAAAADAIGRATNEMVHNQRAADAYLAKANSISLSDAYKNQIMNGSLNIDTITDEDLKKKISDFQSYYESYLSARDNALKLEDKIAELAEKRLEIIEKEYDAIVDINDKIKDAANSKISLNDALGVAIDNPDNYASINKSIKAQEDTYNQLTKKLAEYQKEMDSQLSSGLMKKGSDAYNSALKNIQDFTAKIYDASTSLIELRDKLDQIKIDTIQNVIDRIKRNSDVYDKYISYLQAQDRDVPENLYTDRIDNNNAQVQQNLKQMEIYRKKQAVLDVNSKSYQDYAEKIQTLKENTLELITDNESLQDSIYELRFKPLDDAIQKYSDLEDELKSFRDLLNDDAFLDKQGRITEDGLAQIALLQQSIGTAKQKIADYTTGLQKLKESYDNGVISLTEYNDKSKDYREGIQSSIADVKSYQDSLVDLYKNAMSTEVDYLTSIVTKRQEALKAKADYYSYDKSISKKSNDINAIKAQIMALEGVKYLLL